MTLLTRPIYFESGRESLFGWLHLPPPQLRRDLGIVICKPFGYESVCAHGSICAFADACATVGAAVLRFDYSGTGDSSGSEANHDEIGQWCADIRAAMETLRRELGVTRIGLLGVRFGALLASMVAAEDTSVELMMAVAPVVSGRRYSRELKALHVTSTSGLPVTAEQHSAPPDHSSEPQDSLEIAGFRLLQASADRLAQVDLLRLDGRAVPSALILDRIDLPGAGPWSEALRARGTDVNYQVLPGLLEMIATPHAAQVPQQMVAAVLVYLTDFQDRLPAPAKAHAPQPTKFNASMQLAAEDGAMLIERAVFVDEARTLFAIATHLRQDDSAHPQALRGGIIILNGGATSHIGPNRMYVELARCWAALGYCVLRLDLAGIGDSATRPGQHSNEVYPPGALDDISAAIDFLQRGYGVDKVTLAGLCAGAYHALRSAISGLPVETILLVNPLTFYWKQGAKLSDMQDAQVVGNAGVYAERVLSGKSWHKVLRGRVNVWRVMMVLLRRMILTLGSSVRDLNRKINIRLPQDLGWELQSLASRGVRIVFCFARDDVGRDLLRLQGGSAVNSIGERCRVHVIDGADHVFSQRSARKKLLQLLTSELPR